MKDKMPTRGRPHAHPSPPSRPENGDDGASPPKNSDPVGDECTAVEVEMEVAMENDDTTGVVVLEHASINRPSSSTPPHDSYSFEDDDDDAEKIPPGTYEEEELVERLPPLRTDGRAPVRVTVVERDGGEDHDEHDAVGANEEGAAATAGAKAAGAGAAAGYDACREYTGYRYEYDDDDDDDDSHGYDHDDDDENGHRGCANGGNGQHQHDQSPSSSQCIHLLGRTYRLPQSHLPVRSYESSLFWHTYRHSFVPPIEPYGLRTDAGWGCMLRSAQMLLCHAYRIVLLGRDWTPSTSLNGRRNDSVYRTLVEWFADGPGKKQKRLYGLHNMCAAGLAKLGMLPGEWYGPGAACHVMKELCAFHLEQETKSAKEKERRRRRRRRRQRRHERREGKEVHGIEEEAQRAGVEGDGDDDIGDDEAISGGGTKVFRVHVAREGCVYRDAVESLMSPPAPKHSKGRRRRRRGRGGEENGRGDDHHDDEAGGAVKNNPTFPHPLHNPDHDVDENGDPAGPSRDDDREEWSGPLLLLVPLRLGLKSFQSSQYAVSLSHAFSLEWNVGCLGGSPRHALWFYGMTGNGSDLFGLDPHTIQSAPGRVEKGIVGQQNRRRRRNVWRGEDRNGEYNDGGSGGRSDDDVEDEEDIGNDDDETDVDLTDEYLRSLHQPLPPKPMPISKLDPSLALGFCCPTRRDFDALCDALASWSEHHCRPMGLPELFHVADRAPDYAAMAAAADAALSATAVGGLGSFDCNDVDVDDDLNGGAAHNHGVLDLDDEGSSADDEDEYVLL